jgi:hypothetical protein
MVSRSPAKALAERANDMEAHVHARSNPFIGVIGRAAYQCDSTTQERAF